MYIYNWLTFGVNLKVTTMVIHYQLSQIGCNSVNLTDIEQKLDVALDEPFLTHFS